MTIQSLTSKGKKLVASLSDLIIHHQPVIIALILLASFGSALLMSQQFIDIPRNEDRYSDEALRVRFKQIDQEILAEFQEAQQDRTIEVNSNFEPNRDNPFSE